MNPVSFSRDSGQRGERLAVALRRRRDDVARQRRRRRLLVPWLAVDGDLLEPVAYRLLVETRRRLPGDDALGGPEARRVGREDLVHQRQRAVLVEAELELGVGDDDPPRARERCGLDIETDRDVAD